MRSILALFNDNPRERDVHDLKRLLLGFCGTETIKTEKQLMNAVERAGLETFSNMREVVETFREASSEGIRYKTKDSSIVCPDYFTEYCLNIRRTKDGKYKIYTVNTEHFISSEHWFWSMGD